MPARQSEPPTIPIAGIPPVSTGQPRRRGGASWQDTFATLQHRNFRLFFIGQLVSLIGTWMQSTAQGWLVYQLTGSKVLLGTVVAVGTLPMLLFSLWGGSVADRYPKRTVILISQVAMMLTAFVFAALVGSGHIQPWHILVLSALGGVAMAFDMPARQAPPAVVGPAREKDPSSFRIEHHGVRAEGYPASGANAGTMDNFHLAPPTISVSPAAAGARDTARCGGR